MIHHFIFFLLIGFPIFGQAVDYSDLQSNGIACPKKDSCTRAAGSTSRAQIAIRNSNFTNRNCECDRFCSAFDDCCIDASASSRIARYRNKRLHCMPFSGVIGYGAYVVDSCPSSYWLSSTVRNRCQEDDDLTDPLVSTPVTESSSDTTFKNRYCAECNGATPSSLVSWLLYLNCVTLQANDTMIFQNLKYNTSISKWGVSHEGEFHKCDVIFDKPSYLDGVRLCRPNVIESCPDSWRRLTVKTACESYMAVVYSSDKIYKNVHCAICNGQQVNTLSCDKPWLLISRGNKPFSFALLLDVNRSDGDLVGVVQRCPYGQKYDPFFKKCRTLVCAIPGYKMVNGKCKKD